MHIELRKFFILHIVILVSLILVSCGYNKRLSNTSREMQEKFGAEKSEDFCQYGIYYFYGRNGFPVDYEKSLELFKDAAKMQNAEACDWIAEFYAGGYVYRQNYKKAAYWLEKAASLGNTEVYFRLGVLYEYGGHGLKANSKKADIWYKKASAYSSQESKE